VTPLGALGQVWSDAVDDRGGLRLGPWTLDWWVGAEDRWHLAASEVAVRQRFVADVPVVETAMRVPGGDVLHRAFGVPGGVVFEIENQTAVPVALALVVRGARHIEIDGDALVVDGRRVALPSAPKRMASGDGLFDVVTSGAAAEELTPVRARRGRATAAFIWPLVHRSTLRFGGSTTAEQVVAGWQAHLGRGTRVVLPDDALAGAISLARGLAFGRRDADAALALHRWGHAVEAVDLAHELAPAIAARAEREARRGHDLWGAVELLGLAGEEQAAADAARLAGPPRSWPATDGTSPDFLLGARDGLLHETVDGVALLSAYPGEWHGQGVEVHDAPTRFGRLSFAVRWHGERPALLWELEGEGRLTAPALDPSWSTTDPRGEALLAPVLPAGTPVSLRRG
jgi:hypothetical protein